jgi:biotin carboxyl carrier protein
MSASDLKVIPLGDGRFLVDDGSRQQVAYAVADVDARWVFLNGRVYRLATQRAGARHAHDETALASPMPATVVLVNVVPGQRVTAGDLLVMLEAMKMEVPIRSPADGVIRRVLCRQGELVQPGVALVDLEDA